MRSLQKKAKRQLSIKSKEGRLKRNARPENRKYYKRFRDYPTPPTTSKAMKVASKQTADSLVEFNKTMDNAMKITTDKETK
jgi:hypothetical protein